VTLLAIGSMVGQALAAAEELAQTGISAAVVDARFAKPLDEELILARAEQGPLVTVEENVLTGGFGSAVAELLEDRGVCKAELCRLGLPDRFIEHGKTGRLWAEAGLDAGSIAAAARKLVGAS
jgi:1-deoxy-D-xylulose-5-phosphate synthase